MPMSRLTAACLALIVACGAGAALAAENYAEWPELPSRFPSTGGDGTIIDGYNPVVAGNRCVTTFTALTPDGGRYHNYVEFDATEVAGGTLCSNGRWRSIEGSWSGTTPLRVFIRDGVIRGSQG
jgi:hypothetical protein